MTKAKSKTAKVVKAALAAVKNKNKQKSGRKPAKKKNHSSLGRTLLTGAGRMLGGLIGQPELGASAGASFSQILGMGAYTVNSNSIMNDSTQAPVFNGSDKSFILSHSELITDVVGSVAYASRAFLIDPSNNATFPYLSGIAQNFEQYEFLGLVFTYKPTSGSAIASTNNALGSVILTTEYDVSRPLFANKADMEAYEFATSCEPCNIMHHPVECNPKRDILNNRYVASPVRQQRASTLTASVSNLAVQNNLQYLGRTQLATVGMQAATTVGELWVSYKVKLSIPRKQATDYGMFHLHGGSPLAVGANGLANSYLVTNDSTASMNMVDFTLSGQNSILTFTGLPPQTKILLNLLYSSSSGTTTQGAITSTMTASTFYFADPNTTVSSFFTPNGQTQQALGYAFITPDTSFVTPCTITIPPPTVATASTTWDLYVQIVPTIQMNLNTSASPYVTNIVERELDNQLKLDRLEQMYNRLVSDECKESIYIEQQDCEFPTPRSLQLDATTFRPGNVIHVVKQR